MTDCAEPSTRSRKNTFRHFVNYFWCCHGGTGYDDEWHVSPGRFYADIRNTTRIKTIFPYHLELTKIGKFYILSIELRLSSSQRHNVARVSKIPNKKEAIRASLKVIKKFENDKSRILTMWQKLSYDIPIVNSEGIWVLTVLIDSASSALITKKTFQSHEASLGYGVFYSLEHNNNKWYWIKHDISWHGHSTQGCKKVSFMIWQSIYGYNQVLDTIIDDAINFTKQFYKKDIIEDELAEQYMQAFYDSQE